MKYYIDFEATQYSNEIISIGCIDEIGRKFYSLVSANHKKVTGFITRLTGITKQDIKSAPTSDEVFTNFYHWVMAGGGTNNIFYCYGDGDIEFINSTLKRTTAITAIACLNLLAKNLYDYSKEVKEHYKLIKNIKMIKLIQYYRGGEEVIQKHNSLEDAMFLKEVYDNIQLEDPELECPFPSYQVVGEAAPKKLQPSKHKATTNFEEPEETRPHISAFKGGKFEKFYYSWADCVVELTREAQAKSPQPVLITERAINAIINDVSNSEKLNNKPYGRRWRVHGDIPKGEINV